MFENLAFFYYLAPVVQFIESNYRDLSTKLVKVDCSFQEEVRNVKLLKDDSIAMGHVLSDSFCTSPLYMST